MAQDIFKSGVQPVLTVTTKNKTSVRPPLTPSFSQSNFLDVSLLLGDSVR